MTRTALRILPGRSSDAASSRLTGSIPSRHTRATSAPNTVTTAPPASAPSRWVRPDVLVPACLATSSRLALRRGMCPPSLAEIGLGELAEEDDAELDEPAEAPAEGGELAGEVASADAEDAGGDDLRAGLAGLVDVAAQHAREQRRRVAPDVEARVVLDELEPAEGQRVARPVAEEEPVEHVLDARLGVDEQVEGAVLDRQLPAERVAHDVAVGAGAAPRVVREPGHVVDGDREVELERARPVALGRGPAQVVLLSEGDVPEHLLGEPDAGHVAAASAAGGGAGGRGGKRAARAGVGKLGVRPAGPGVTRPAG